MPRQWPKIEEHIADAVAKGRKGEFWAAKRHALGGTFFEPTILTQVTPKMLVAREETFGPRWRPLFKFQTEAEAIAMANDNRVRPWPRIYTTRDLARSWRVLRGDRIRHRRVEHRKLFPPKWRPFGGRQGIGNRARKGRKYGISRLHRDEVRVRRAEVS